jgi:methyl-accepting chemotaxis protein
MKISMLNAKSIGSRMLGVMALVILLVFAVNYIAIVQISDRAFDRAVRVLGNEHAAQLRAEKSNALGYLHLNALTISAITLIIGLIAFSVLVQLLLKRPMNQLLAASRALASNTGDLTFKVGVNSDDELGKLGFALNELFSNMAGIIRMIRATADKVNFSAQNLSAATEQMNSITEETSTTVQNIAKSTDHQARKVDEMIKEIRNMERSVKQVANSAELAASAATNASETAAKGGDSAKEAVEKINKIYNVIQESAEIIRHLGERSTQIDEIVDVITDIADQTNLLALNAAIEAARAGEAGSGFAVVADEVRKLAEGSAEAAEEIATLVRQTQDDTRTAVKSIELGAKEVTEGKDVITRTGQSLDEIVDVLRSSGDMARRISAATKELSRGMKNVTGSIDEIAASAEKNASATQETAASMEQMTSSMEDVASSAQKLSDMAIQLREHVGRFNVGAEEREEVTVTS